MQRITNQSCSESAAVCDAAEEAARKKMGEFRDLLELVTFRGARIGEDVTALIYRKHEDTPEEEKYVFFFSPDQRAELLRTFGRMAANPDSRFTFSDAAVCCHKIMSARMP